MRLFIFAMDNWNSGEYGNGESEKNKSKATFVRMPATLTTGICKRITLRMFGTTDHRTRDH